MAQYPKGDGTFFTPKKQQNKVWYYMPTDNKHCWSAQPDGGQGGSDAKVSSKDRPE